MGASERRPPQLFVSLGSAPVDICGAVHVVLGVECKRVAPKCQPRYLMCTAYIDRHQVVVVPTAPSNSFQLLALLAFVLPGIVFQGVRAFFVGPSPTQRDTAAKVVSALTFSTLLAIVLLPMWGADIAVVLKSFSGEEAPNGVLVAPILKAVVFVFVIPTLTALVTVVAPAVRPWRGWHHVWRKLKPYNPAPSAWDLLFRRTEPLFVRVTMKNGDLQAGYFGEQSFATGYPDRHELLLEEAIEVSEDGELGERLGVQLWIDGEDVATIEVHPGEPEAPADQTGGRHD